MENVNLTAVRGDSFIKTLTFTDSSGNAIDITGWKVYFTIKEDESDSDDDALIKKDITSHSDPTNGKTNIEVEATDTNSLLGVYYYDIQVKKGSGEIFTVMKGKITFKADITRRVS